MFFYKFPSKVGIQASSPDLSPTTPAQAAQTEPREPLQPVLGEEYIRHSSTSVLGQFGFQYTLQRVH